MDATACLKYEIPTWRITGRAANLEHSRILLSEMASPSHLFWSSRQILGSMIKLVRDITLNPRKLGPGKFGLR
ncbi:hypothetical protein MAUB1S_06344 [Mycolicibacterium aubagnense]